jgi:hypothetical protein
MNSLLSALESCEAHFATITETKLESDPPFLEGYTWLKKNRNIKQGGGVAIAIRNDILSQVRIIDKVEPDDDTEILWVAVGNRNTQKSKYKNLAIGVFYGPQENECREKVEKIYSIVSTHINTIKQDHKIILTGDFNSKLQIQSSEIKQEISPNGRFLQQMLQTTDTQPISIQVTEPRWTRINRKNTNEKSIIDYVITDKEEHIEEIEIDSEGSYRLKSNNGTETDHETILITANLEKQTETKISKTWKLKEEPHKWNIYNQIIKNNLDKDKEPSYNDFENTIKEALNKAFGKKTIQTGRKKNESKCIKEARRKKREAKKEFEQAIKIKHDIAEKLDKYKSAQRTLRQEIEKEQRDHIESQYNRIIQEGGSKAQLFWKVRRKIVGNREIDYDHVTEDGEKITDPEHSKLSIAEYYENLYQARPAEEDEKENTKHIEQCVEKWAISPEYIGEQNKITKTEINKAIKKLKKGKSMGPDEIPNEAIMKMDDVNRNKLRLVFNNILQMQSPPEQWETGIITRLYKGKGTRGKCSNERGITVASNMGKLFERLVNERAKKKVTVSDAQAGGKEKRATTDHLLILKEIVTSQKEKKRPIFLAYLDVTKAYDKAWLTGIMYALHENGLKGPLWNIVRKLNSNLMDPQDQ